MKRLLPLLLASSFLTLPSTADAWVPIATCFNGDPVVWQSFPVGWHLRDKLSGANNFYSQLSDTQVYNAMQAGWDVWSNPATCSSDFTSVYLGTTSTQALMNSSTPVIEFFENSWPSGYGGVNSTIAVTLPVWSGCEYIRGDQIYNGVGFDFTVTNSPGFNDTDLQSIAAHEHGHWLGLDHSPFSSATMYASYVGGTGARSLHTDDQAGVCDMYPGSGPVETNCSDGIDNDGDGDIDCADSNCSGFPGCTCAATDVLTCGGTTTGSNAGNASNVTTYSCSNWDTTGPEAVYAITPAISGTVQVDMTGLGGDLDLFVTTGSGGACTPNSCLDASGNENLTSESVSWAATGGTTYYVVADGWNGATSSFTLSASCPTGATEVACADGFDDDGDGDVDCADSDCANDPNCNAPSTELDCADGLDDDVDGLTDCFDPDCAGDPACPQTVCQADDILPCNTPMSGNTSGLTNEVNQWSCSTWQNTGPEGVYALTPPASGTVTVDLTNL